MIRVRLKSRFKGKARAGTFIRLTRSGQWLILRDGRKKALPYQVGVWEFDM